jgi:branched-chain amino acid transport system substrate-binding protein
MQVRTALAPLLVAALVATSCGGDEQGDDGANEEQDGQGGGAPTEVETGEGVDDEEIRVAVLNDFSGPIASIGTPAAVGAEIYFEALNAEGGVCGRDVTVVREDTQYDSQVAIQAYRAVEGDVAFITQLTGTQTVFALSEDVARDNLTTLAGSLAGAVIPLEDMFVVQTPFALEAINGVSWAVDTAVDAGDVDAGDDGVVQVGVIYQGDAYGEEGLDAVQHAVDELGDDAAELVADASYSQGDEDLTAQVQDMEQAGAEVVWLHDTPQQTAAILGVAAQRDYHPLFVGTSASYSSALAEPLGDLLDGFRVVTSNVSWGEDVPEMRTMLQAVEDYAPDQEPDNWLVTGWITGMITRAALERACDQGDLTRDGIEAAMDGLEVELNDMAPDVRYGSSPEERIPARQTRVNEIDLRSTFPRKVSDLEASEAAESWTLPDS